MVDMATGDTTTARGLLMLMLPLMLMLMRGTAMDTVLAMDTLDTVMDTVMDTAMADMVMPAMDTVMDTDTVMATATTDKFSLPKPAPCSTTMVIHPDLSVTHQSCNCSKKWIVSV